MTFPIEEKLVIAVSSSALFDLTESHGVFVNDGPQAYKAFQEKNLNTILKKGVAFPFIKRFLRINQRFPEQQPVEVILLSRNSALTGRRVFRSIIHYGLSITRAAFMDGRSPYEYLPAFNAALFLTTNNDDVQQAIQAGYPAGKVLPVKGVVDKDSDEELRIAFDFDGVIVDDESETVYKNGDLPKFHDYEQANINKPHQPGPLEKLFRRIAKLQQLEDAELKRQHDYQRMIRTAIVTARSAPAHERVITTLESWGVCANEVFFLGGMKKSRILGQLKPHMFFDDQRAHLHSPAGDIPMVHVPFGVANTPFSEKDAVPEPIDTSVSS